MSEIVPLDAETLKRFPLPDHSGDANKDQRGRALVIGGSRGVPGAALLAARGALRAGAGKLQIAVVEGIAVPVGVAMLEALVAGHAEADHGCFKASAADGLAERAGAADGVAIGPGMREGDHLVAILRAVLARRETKIVVDAAAIAALAELADAAKAHGNLVLTPHTGEMAKLHRCEEAEVEGDPLGCARRAAETFGAVTLMKGPQSHIVAPGGETFLYAGGGVGLATSGSGDTLAGIICGLLARGADPLTACLWGVWLHGEAGRRLAEQVGPVGFMAREIVEEVPGLLAGR